jgi:hypothetical protein
MNDLATAFRSAVDNGTIAKFGAAITTAFDGAIKWVKAFAAEVDFTALAARMQAFATSTQDTFTKIGEYATNAGNIVKSVYGVMSSGINAVLVVVYGLGEAFAGVASNIQSGLALLLQGLAKITFGDLSASFKKAADEVKLSAAATWAASEAFAKKGQQAFIDMSNGAELARDGWDGLTAGTAAASAQASASTPAINTMAGALTDAGNAAQEAGNKANCGPQNGCNHGCCQTNRKREARSPQKPRQDISSKVVSAKRIVLGEWAQEAIGRVGLIWRMEGEERGDQRCKDNEKEDGRPEYSKTIAAQ